MKFKGLVLIPLVVAGISILSACTTTDNVMKSWMGQPESKLLARWGAPDSLRELPDGTKVYTWKRIWYDQAGYPQQGRQTFTVDAAGFVKSWSYENLPKVVLKQ